MRSGTRAVPGRGPRSPALSGPRPTTTLLLVVASGACGPGADTPGASGVKVTDSAGVTEARLGSLADLILATTPVEEVFRVGDAASGLELFQVAAARFLPDGRLALANGGTREIIVLGQDGGALHRFGEPGEGPGQFGAISTLHVDGDGSLVVYDTRMGRLTTHSPAGDVLATRRLSPPSRVLDLRPLALLADGRILAVWGAQRMFARGGVVRDTTPLMVLDSTGVVLDTLGLWAASEWSYSSTDQGSFRTAVGFGRELLAAGRSGRVVLGSTDSLDVTGYGPDATVTLRIVGEALPTPVTEAEARRWWADRVASLPEDAPDFVRAGYESAPVRESRPAFGGLLADASGRTWVGAFAPPGAADRDWWVFGTDGRPTLHVTLPTGAELLDVQDGRLAVLERDDLGVETVRVLLLAPEG